MRLFLFKPDLSSIELNGLVILIIITISCSLSFFAGFKCATQTTVNRIEVTDTQFVYLDTLQFTEANLAMVIDHFDIWYPQIALKQAKLETGDFTSDIFKDNNNLFGFRVFGSWKGKEMPFKNRGHLVFPHWTKSVEHYKMWQKKNYNQKTYLQFLKRVGYAEATNYTEILKK
mgnify:CR=1 FL=1|jgi:uncharacterized FlgJ-related protein